MDKNKSNSNSDESVIDDDNLDIKGEFDEKSDEEFLDDLSEETEEPNDEEGSNIDHLEEPVPETVEDDLRHSDEYKITEDLDKNKTIEEAEADAENSSDIFKSDAEIDAAVDDIVRTESDESIAEADAKLAALAESKKKKSFKQKLSVAFHSWWENKPIRYGTFAGLFVLFTLVTLLPASRYATLNLIGVRVSSSMIVVDSETGLPLKNINVKLQDKVGVTDSEGSVSLYGLKLGKSDLLITKVGYADNQKTIVLGWGSNPIGEQDLVATGAQFTFVLSDWKSGDKITEAEAVSGESSAKADNEGKIILTVGQEEAENAEVTIIAKNYREEKLSGEELSAQVIELSLVPSKKHVFVSNRNKEFDLYKIDVDGQNEEVLLAATGKEREIPTVVVHPTKDIVAYVSSRDGETNQDKFILEGLYIVNSIDGKLIKVSRSEQIQVIGWHGDKLIYLQVVEGTSAGSAQRSKLISYDETNGDKVELASANYFNDAELVEDTLYYSVSSYAVPPSQAKLFSVKVDGKDYKKIVDKQVWSIFRTDYNKLLFNSEDQKWYSLEFGKEAVEVPQVATAVSRNYVDNPSRSKTAWVEIRDGKGVLLNSQVNEFREQQSIVLPGLDNVLYWLNDSTVVFRVISNNETADYVLNLDGGDPQKITDITTSRDKYF